MESIRAEGVSKCYRKGGGPSAWQHLLARLKGSQQPAKRSREFWALKDVSFSVEPGTILGVIGPNGAGKTTLLKLIARITPPTEGRIIGRGFVAPLLEIGTGLRAELSARDNIDLYAAWHGISRAEVERRTADIMAFAELEEFADTPIRNLSSGMYVRLAFSIAINMQPDILLADEVLAVGDISFQERCLQRVEEAGKAGMTVLFVSHDMAAIQRLCDRVIWLNAGQLMEDGEAETVVSHYEQAAWTLTKSTGKKGAKGNHANEHGQILSVRLLSADGREIGAARHCDELHLTMTYSALRPGLELRCALAIYARGVLAFRAVQPEDTRVDDPGIYRAVVRIPPNLLADTIYTVKAGIFMSVDGQEFQLVLDNALTFRVYAGENESTRTMLARGHQGTATAGVVMPHLAWDVVRERAVVVDR
jgi:lipopolysaccharide transport system ATP-binding protein